MRLSAFWLICRDLVPRARAARRSSLAQFYKNALFPSFSRVHTSFPPQIGQEQGKLSTNRRLSPSFGAVLSGLTTPRACLRAGAPGYQSFFHIFYSVAGYEHEGADLKASLTIHHRTEASQLP